MWISIGCGGIGLIFYYNSDQGKKNMPYAELTLLISTYLTFLFNPMIIGLVYNERRNYKLPDSIIKEKFLLKISKTNFESNHKEIEGMTYISDFFKKEEKNKHAVLLGFFSFSLAFAKTVFLVKYICNMKASVFHKD
jgi:hypothetical protein